MVPTQPTGYWTGPPATSGWPPPPVAPVPSQRGPGGALIAILVVSGVILLVMAGAATWLGFRPGGMFASTPSSTVALPPVEPSPSPSPSDAGPIEVEGVLLLSGAQYTTVSDTDNTCYGVGNYDGLQGGTQVTVSDANGKIVAVGELDTGTTDGQSDCSLHFAVTDVPEGVGPYGVTIGRLTPLHYAEGSTTNLRISVT